MIDYYEEALLEAVMFCMTRGLTEEYVVALDVDGFGEVYKYLKRLEARGNIRDLNTARLAMGTDKKDYGKAIKMMEVWLPAVETIKTGDGQEGFKKLLTKGF